MTEKKNKKITIVGEMERAMGAYVYIYIDPRDGNPFYVGKGRGDRVFAHLDSPDHEKAEQIKAIRKTGQDPRIDILRYGLSDAQALLVEAAVIDFIGRDDLLNRASGVKHGCGRISAHELSEVLKARSAKPVKVRHKAVLLNLNREYRYGMTNPDGTTTDALYKVTSGSWRAGIQRAQKAECVMAVYQGVVREVYRIDEWYVAHDNKQRICFNGAVAEDIRGQYVGRRVDSGKKGSQNPVRYKGI